MLTATTITVENIRHSSDILYVMKTGELFDGETLSDSGLKRVPFEPFY